VHKPEATKAAPDQGAARRRTRGSRPPVDVLRSVQAATDDAAEEHAASASAVGETRPTPGRRSASGAAGDSPDAVKSESEAAQQ
jgi:hypothetical protein